MDRVAKLVRNDHTDSRLPPCPCSHPHPQGSNLYFYTGPGGAAKIKTGKRKSIDDLLKLPQRPIDGGKTKEEILDEQDIKIRKIQEKYDEDMAKFDREIEGEKRKREKREINFRVNAVFRNRLKIELTEAKMRSAVKANLCFLKSIEAGLTPSARHEAFKKSVRTRQALRYIMITEPFTNDQLKWTLEEISKFWMRNPKEQRDNSEYVWHVILAECFIKVYSDQFGVSRAQAEVMIGETPIREEPRLETGRTEGETEEDVYEKE